MSEQTSFLCSPINSSGLLHRTQDLNFMHDVVYWLCLGIATSKHESHSITFSLPTDLWARRSTLHIIEIPSGSDQTWRRRFHMTVLTVWPGQTWLTRCLWCRSVSFIRSSLPVIVAEIDTQGVDVEDQSHSAANQFCNHFSKTESKEIKTLRKEQ